MSVHSDTEPSDEQSSVLELLFEIEQMSIDEEGDGDTTEAFGSKKGVMGGAMLIGEEDNVLKIVERKQNESSEETPEIAESVDLARIHLGSCYAGIHWRWRRWSRKEEHGQETRFYGAYLKY